MRAWTGFGCGRLCLVLLLQPWGWACLGEGNPPHSPGAGPLDGAAGHNGAERADAEGADAEQAGAGQNGASPQGQPPANVAAAGEPFDIPLDITVDFGAFGITFGAATVTPRAGEPARVDVTLPFEAENRSNQTTIPFLAAAFDGLFLEVAGTHYAGQADAPFVPGNKRGQGALYWEIDGMDIDALRSATLTLGTPDRNQVTIAFADPQATETLVLRWIDGFTIPGYLATTFAFDHIQIHFHDYNANRPLAAGTAKLVLVGTLSADPEMGRYGQYWGTDNAFLTLPDGTSRPPRHLNRAVYPGDHMPFEIAFDVPQPAAGTYTFGLANGGHDEEVRTFEVP